MPLTFPAIESASFFSTTLVEERPPVDFLALYIPSNPFHSLANNVVPAVVLFSALLGVALMGVEKKEPLLELAAGPGAGARPGQPPRRPPHPVRALRHRRAHRRARSSSSSSRRLRVFLLAYAAMALLLTLWVFPGLVGVPDPDPRPARAAVDARRADHRLHHRRPVRRAAHADRPLEGAPRGARGAGEPEDGRRPTSSCPPSTTSRTPPSCSR